MSGVANGSLDTDGPSAKVSIWLSAEVFCATSTAVSIDTKKKPRLKKCGQKT
jgi:hypothetical protein